MPPYLPIQGLNRSQNVRIGTGATAQKLSAFVTTYVDLGDGPSRRDLQRHSTLGSFLVVGPATDENGQYVLQTGGVVSAGTGLSVNVTAGTFVNRTTGQMNLPGLAGTNVALAAAHATLERTDLVVWNATSGAVAIVTGTNAAVGTSSAPALAANQVPLATVKVPPTATVPGTITSF